MSRIYFIYKKWHEMCNYKRMAEIFLKEESYQIIGACMAVHKELGSGFLEAVYQEALTIEFRNRNIPHVCEKALQLYYKNVPLYKTYIVDIICYEKIILEIKAVVKLTYEHESQLINYLKATKMKLGILINFGDKSLEYKRFIN